MITDSSDIINQANIVQQQATCPKTHTWVMASAGTGKTKILTNRILRLLLEGINPPSILALTFTNAAAGEMIHRVLNQLKQWAIADDKEISDDIHKVLKTTITDDHIAVARGLFFKVSQPTNRFQIQTVHGFCQNILSHFPLEAGLPLNWQLSKPYDQYHLLMQAIDKIMDLPFMQNLYEKYEASYVKKIIYESCLKNSVQTLFTAQSLPELLLKLRSLLMPSENVAIPDPQEWPLKLLIDSLKSGNDKEIKLSQSLIDDLNIDNFQNIFSTIKSLGFTLKNERRKKIFSHEFIKSNTDSVNLFESMWASIKAYLQTTKINNLYNLTASLWQAIFYTLKNYHQLKLSRHVIDFNDLLFYTLKVLHQPDINHWLLYKLSLKFSHVLVDEAQDTSIEQWSIILKIIEDFFVGKSANTHDKSIFIVGDEKQSIYRFQGADPESYNQIRDLVKDKVINSGFKWQQLNLQVSFRSSQPILDFINHFFKETDFIQGIGSDPKSLEHQSAYPLHYGKVELWPVIPISEDESVSQYNIKYSKKIAAMISKWLRDCKHLAPYNRIIEPSDIMILFQYRSPLFYQLISTLKRFHLPVMGPDRLVLLDQLYIQDLLAFARFIEKPYDDYNLACLLKGPLFRLSDDAIFNICNQRQSSVWYAVQTNSSYKSIYLRLTHWQQLSFTLSAYELYMHILNYERGHEDLIGVFGPSCQDGIQAFLEYALQFTTENDDVTSTDFLQWFLKLKPVLKRETQSKQGIRVMTVHGAKGLQSPIVILPDATYANQDKNKTFWSNLKGEKYPIIKLGESEIPDHLIEDFNDQITKDRLEYYRLFYVAITRAECELYIMGPDSKKSLSEYSWYYHIKEYLSQTPNIKNLTGNLDSGWIITNAAQETNGDWENKINEETNVVFHNKQNSPPDWYFKKVIQQPYRDKIIDLNNVKNDQSINQSESMVWIKNCYVIGDYQSKKYGFTVTLLNIKRDEKSLVACLETEVNNDLSQFEIEEIMHHLIQKIYQDFTIVINLTIKENSEKDDENEAA